MKNIRFWTLVGIVVAAAAARLIPHPPNFTPIAAMALFGGATFANRRMAFAIPLLAMALSDLVLGLTRYGLAALASRPAVYGCFLLTVALGVAARRRPGRVAAAALGSSVLFFLVTNFSVWIGSGLYPLTWEGLIACYTAAVPFFRNTLAGTAFYTLMVFGGFGLAQRYILVLREERSVTLYHPR